MKRAHLGLAILAALLVALPAFAGSYALSVATLILYFAYTGQAWNVMMGFAGQLSLGHSLYVGVGAYAAGAIFFHYWAQWLGSALPLTHFLVLVRGIMLKGNGILQLWPQIWPILAFMLVVIAIGLRFYKRTLD